MDYFLKAAGIKLESQLIKNCGHQDSLMGKGASLSFDRIKRFLSQPISTPIAEPAVNNDILNVASLAGAGLPVPRFFALAMAEGAGGKGAVLIEKRGKEQCVGVGVFGIMVPRVFGNNGAHTRVCIKQRDDFDCGFGSLGKKLDDLVPPILPFLLGLVGMGSMGSEQLDDEEKPCQP